MQALERRYFKYLQLLASDTQVRLGGRGIRSCSRAWDLGVPQGWGAQVGFKMGKPRPSAWVMVLLLSLPGQWDLPPGPTHCVGCPPASVSSSAASYLRGQLGVYSSAPRPQGPTRFPQVAVSRLPRQHWEALGPPEAPHEQPWPLPVVVQLGKQLAEVLVQTVRMPGHLAERKGSCKLMPVLYHVYSFRSFRQVGLWNPLPA